MQGACQLGIRRHCAVYYLMGGCRLLSQLVWDFIRQELKIDCVNNIPSICIGKHVKDHFLAVYVIFPTGQSPGSPYPGCSLPAAGSVIFTFPCLFPFWNQAPNSFVETHRVNNTQPIKLYYSLFSRLASTQGLHIHLCKVSVSAGNLFRFIWHLFPDLFCEGKPKGSNIFLALTSIFLPHRFIG